MPIPKHLERDWLVEHPFEVRNALARLALEKDITLFIAGGAVRDWVMGKPCRDLDITVNDGAVRHARYVAKLLGAAFVVLDEKEGVARVVRSDIVLDFSQFREGGKTLEADLLKRDFTINALAVEFDPQSAGLLPPYEIIDPAAGLADIANKTIRAINQAAFVSDPLRLLRSYRFCATLGFVLEKKTAKTVARLRGLILQPAPERILYELDLIMESPRAARTFGMMAQDGLLWEIFPELGGGRDVEQPPSHHLDVFQHNLETLRWMEQLQGERVLSRYFPSAAREMQEYLKTPGRSVSLKWAALFHDVGKPAAYKPRGERITFYNHDRLGADAFRLIAKRLRMSRELSERIARFIACHMWPFHLNNARNKTGIGAKACLRLVKAVDDDLPGLFLLAMADSLAGRGPGKPEAMEESLARLQEEVFKVYHEAIKPVLTRPPLMNGHDLKRLFALTPGPLFREILNGLEQAQVSGKVRTREEARLWVESFLHEGDRMHKKV